MNDIYHHSKDVIEAHNSRDLHSKFSHSTSAIINAAQIAASFKAHPMTQVALDVSAYAWDKLNGLPAPDIEMPGDIHLKR